MALSIEEATREAIRNNDLLRSRFASLYVMGLEFKPGVPVHVRTGAMLDGKVDPSLLQSRTTLEPRTNSSDTPPTGNIKPESLRCALLREASELTSGARNQSYGDPSINLGCAQELYDVYTKYAKRRWHTYQPAHEQAISQICTKLGRIATGSGPHRDNYLDGASYFAIAYEVEVQPLPGNTLSRAHEVAAPKG